jgi:NTP pyrophosphatase (non-canonical NTP hydrolase)
VNSNTHENIFGLLQEYTESVVKRTMNPNANGHYYTFGWFSEAGEVASLYKKERWHQKATPDSDYVDELGDLLWYTCALGESYGLPVSDCLDASEAVPEVASAPAQFQLPGAIMALSGLVGQTVGGIIALRVGTDELIMTLALTVRLIARIAELRGSSLEAVVEFNRKKLKARFKDGFVSYDQRGDLN